jgi:thioredoxin 1
VISITDHDFNKTVLESPTPVLVHFWAPWCGVCRRINPLLATLEAQWGSSIHLANVNADENFKLANQYRLMTLPTLLLFDQGRVIHRIENVSRIGSLKEDLNQALRDRLAMALTSNLQAQSH